MADLTARSIGAGNKPCVGAQFSRIDKPMNVIYLKGYYCRKDLTETRNRTQCGGSTIVTNGFINPSVTISNMMLELIQYSRWAASNKSSGGSSS
jgi:hypothetical protein